MSFKSKDEAEVARATADLLLLAVLPSPLGVRIFDKLRQIEDQAVKGAFLGGTPENLNIMMERRGAYRVAQQFRTMFTDIENEGKDAIEWLAEDSASHNGTK